MTEDIRESLIDAVIAADLACPEQVADAVLAAAEAGGMAAGLAELRRAVELDAAERSGRWRYWRHWSMAESATSRANRGWPKRSI